MSGAQALDSVSSDDGVVQDGEATLDLTPPSRTASRTTTISVGDTETRNGTPGKSQRFDLIEELGRGGMGVVLRGHDPDLRREVAVKILRHPGDPVREARFITEAQITGQLEHPSIIPVHEFGRDTEGRPWFAMKLVRGRTLGDVLEARVTDAATRDQWPLSRLIGVLIQVAHAVAFAHSRGIIHRDLKPANIMLGDFGEVLVVDWGLGRPYRDGPSMPEASTVVMQDEPLRYTLDGAVVGTPCYMPPEQARGELDRLGPASDQFSLGATLCEIISGRPPLAGSTVSDVVRRAAEGLADLPRNDWQRRQVPRPLLAILRRAMASEPLDRYPGCEALADDLQRFIDHRAVSVDGGGLVEAAMLTVRRHRLTSLVAGVATVALVGMGSAGYVLKEQERRAAVTAQHHAEQALAQADEQRRVAESGRRRERALTNGSERQARLLERTRTMALVAQAEAALAANRPATAREVIEHITDEEHGWLVRLVMARVGGATARTTMSRPEDQLLATRAGLVLMGRDGRVRLIPYDGPERSAPAVGRPVHLAATDSEGRSLWASLVGGGLLQLDGTSLRPITSRLGEPVATHVAVTDGLVLTAQVQGVRWQGQESGERTWQGVTAVAVAPDRSWWAAAMSGTLVVHPAQELERRLPISEPLEHLAVLRDGMRLGAASGQRVRVWSMPSAIAVADMMLDAPVTSLGFGPDGVWAFGTSHGEVVVWDEDASMVALRLPVGEGPVEQVVWSPDGHVLAARVRSGRVMLWGEP